MKFSSWLLLGISCSWLLLVGCKHANDIVNTPVVDGACSDNTGNRFVDCGNGTVTDTNPGHVANAGLIWLKNADCVGVKTWADGTAWAYGLKSGDCGLAFADQK